MSVFEYGLQDSKSGWMLLSFHRDVEPLDRKVRCSVDAQMVCLGWFSSGRFCAGVQVR